MLSLHKTSANAFVQPRVSSEIRHPFACPDARDDLAPHAWLPRPHGGGADLCISSVGEAPSTTHGRSLSAKHLAGSIHIVFASVCVVYRATGIGECGSTAHLGFYRLVLGGHLELCTFCRLPRGRL